MSGPVARWSTVSSRRARHLPHGAVTVLLLLGGLLGVVYAVVTPINQLTQPGGVVDVQLADQGPLARAVAQLGPAGSAGLRLAGDAGAPALHLGVAELPWVLRLLTELPGASAALALGLAAWYLVPVIGSVRRGEPFHPRNPRRLAAAAVLLLAASFAAGLLRPAVSVAVLEHLGLADGGALMPPPMALDLTLLAGVAVLLVLADAFRRGSRLTEDVEGLV